jgi:acyl carrier protein
MSCSEAQVRGLIADNLLDPAGRKVLLDLPASESMIEAGLLDSLGVVQLVGLLERTFDLVFDPLEIRVENLESVERIVGLIRRKHASGRPAAKER